MGGYPELRRKSCVSVGYRVGLSESRLSQDHVASFAAAEHSWQRMLDEVFMCQVSV